VVWCDDSTLNTTTCSEANCGFDPDLPGVDCSGETHEPADTDPDIDCPDLPEEDAGPDAGAGGKDDGCSCSAAGSSTLRGLLALVLTVLVG
jgi:hypothetical protein